MNEHGKSDSPIVPKKLTNKVCGAPQSAELVEGRGLAKGNSDSQTRSRTQSRKDLYQEWIRIRQAAQKDKNVLIHLPAYAFDPRQEPSAVIPHAGICAGGAGQPASLPQSVPLPLGLLEAL